MGLEGRVMAVPFRSLRKEEVVAINKILAAIKTAECVADFICTWYVQKLHGISLVSKLERICHTNLAGKEIET